jgi:probable addiction module antidote protein
MALKTTPWNPIDYLDTPERIALYLEAAFEDGDPALITAAIGDAARAYGMTRLAKDTGLSREALYRALSEDGNPEFTRSSVKCMSSSERKHVCIMSPYRLGGRNLDGDLRCYRGVDVHFFRRRSDGHD